MKVLAKTVSWAVVSGLLIFVPAYCATYELWTSVVVAFFGVAAKTPLFPVHEVVFEWAWGDKK